RVQRQSCDLFEHGSSWPQERAAQGTGSRPDPGIAPTRPTTATAGRHRRRPADRGCPPRGVPPTAGTIGYGRLAPSAIAWCHWHMTGAERLRAAGLRVTRPRLAVLEVLSRGGHLEAEQIATEVRERLHPVSTQAVYDVLAALTRVGMLRRIEPAG